jgi:hypothetical protein
MGMVQGAGVVCYEIESLPLLPARYLVTTAVHDSRYAKAYDYHKQAYSFRVNMGEGQEAQGLIAMPATWRWEPESTLQPVQG